MSVSCCCFARGGGRQYSFAIFKPWKNRLLMLSKKQSRHQAVLRMVDGRMLGEWHLQQLEWFISEKFKFLIFHHKQKNSVQLVEPLFMSFPLLWPTVHQSEPAQEHHHKRGEDPGSLAQRNQAVGQEQPPVCPTGQAPLSNVSTSKTLGSSYPCYYCYHP